MSAPIASPPQALPKTSGGLLPAADPSTRTGGFFRRSELGRALWTFRKEFAWVMVFSFIANALMLTPTLYMLQVFDRVLLSGNTLTLLALTGVAVLFFLVMGLAEWLRARLLVRAGARFDDRLNARVFNATFEARLRGSSTNPLQSLNDLTSLRQFITGSGVFAVMDLPWVTVYLAVLFLMHPVLGWTSLAFCVVQLALALVTHRLTSQRLKQTQELNLESHGYLQAKLRNAETVEALGMLGNLRRQWLSVHERHNLAHANTAEMTRRVQAVTKFVQYTQQSLVLAVGALLALDGAISAGAMIAANALMNNALRPLSTVVQLWNQYIDSAAAYRRLETVLQAHPERQGNPASGALTGAIALRGLQATVPGRPKPILDGLDATIEPGEIIAVVGPSGAGKSTLARCLVGIWPDIQGEVLLDGQPLQRWSREDLGPQIGYLPQDIEMFDGTIAENIARFADLPAAAVIEAAQRTGIHEMILRLPKGYDTPMGDAGSLLSGGQRQRIGLARAIVGQPRIVVLDEPNANLDDAGEAALIQTVRDLKARGSTVIMIVHQRHLLAVADRVLVLEQGRIVRLAPLAPPSTPVVFPSPTSQS
jgi:ATP-binding cassette, subfamily C, bacterial exporter for protease/lipase